MLKTTIKNIRIFIMVLFLLVIAITSNILNNNQPPVPSLILGLVQTSIFIFLYCAWGISIGQRISQTQVRFIMQWIAFLLVFWIFLRAVKYYIFAEGSPASRYLWYLYYIPMLLIPLLSFFVALSLGKPDYYKIPRWNYTFFGLCILLIIIVLTNDVHMLVFTFPDKNLEYSDAGHGYGTVYLLIYVWILCMSVASLFIIIIKCRIPDIKKVFWLPIMPVIIAFIYGICYTFNILRIFKDITVVFTASIATTFEFCIQVGLIRTNTGYIELFEAGSYGAQITDRNFNVKYSSLYTTDIPYSVMCKTMSSIVKIDENTLLNSHSITNGHIIWTEDIGELNALIERLKANRESIAEAVTLEEQNYKAKLKISALKEKRSLYEKLQKQTAGQIDLLYDLLSLYDKESDEEKKKRLSAMLIVVGTYIKRRGNLLFLSEKSKVLDCADLTMCLQETVSNLELLNVNCALLAEEDAVISAMDACEIYDFFEKVIETAMKDMRFILIRLDFLDKVPRLRMEIECETSLIKFALSADKCVFNEGVWYITRCFKKGGGR